MHAIFWRERKTTVGLVHAVANMLWNQRPRLHLEKANGVNALHTRLATVGYIYITLLNTVAYGTGYAKATTLDLIFIILSGKYIIHY